jgi:uncharacterized membrane protein YeaQ/YmgE (transglycosylase-associated protein family)
MGVKEQALSKGRVLRGVLAFEVLGFIAAIASTWLTEFYDPPFNFGQVLLESLLIAVVGGVTIFLTYRIIARLKYLEGFLSICASCKKVRVDDQWVGIESVLFKRSDLQLSHGVCDECAARLYGDILQKDTK